MKTVEEIYQRTLASSDPKYYKDIKRELMSEIGDDYEKLKAYKMVCESYGTLNFNIMAATFIISFGTFIINIFPKKGIDVKKSIWGELFQSVAIQCIAAIGIIGIFVLMALLIKMHIREKKYQQVLLVLKGIEKEMFLNKLGVKEKTESKKKEE